MTPHVEKRMVDRGFTETDLRAMLARATEWRPDVVDGRFRIATRHGGGPWEVIVEPDASSSALVIVTAYPLEERR